jgi:hypothetical protein
MSVIGRRLAGAFLLAGALLFPGAALADTLHADFDGDGIHDRIDLAARVTELNVRLSRSPIMQQLSAGDVILRFVVADIDRDGRPDVLARTRRDGLQIWINTGRGHFAAHSSKVSRLRPAGQLNVRSLSARPSDDSACNDQTRELVSSCSPRGQPLVESCRAAAIPGAREFPFQHSPRIARGPPSLLVA